ncbi:MULTISPECIES: ABC transporter ATP-binding protein/permease [Acidiphilium]|uniref:Putative ATP-binding cassette transporter n=1 Tax=Acidiphilium rubrum TaxID=526 RepID=A0A8G2FEF7_ACIRU|nr:MULTISPECIES: ABC transporter ATP-binding protein/permease [Acidiphilium]SIR26882.1 putative ATP-binding cassette transporter [Acidiphilium rubrum]
MDADLARTGFFYRLRYLALPYFRSEERWRAIGLASLIIALTLSIVGLNLGFTTWYNAFWNALQKYQISLIWYNVGVFCALALGWVVINSAQQFCIQILQIRWRRWLTTRIIDHWMSNNTHYRLQLDAQEIDNPDQRMSDDIDFFTGQSVNLPISALQAVVTIVSYGVLLWSLSAKLVFFGVKIPGALLWVNLLYAIAGTWFVLKIGRPLFYLNNIQQKVMGDFRFELIRVRDNSETIATAHSGGAEAARLKTRFGPVVDIFHRRIYRNLYVNGFTFSFNQAAVLVPLIVTIPAYLAKTILVGGIIEISSAFNQTQQAFAFILNNFSSVGSGYLSITEWRAVLDRLYTFEVSLRHHQTQAAAPKITYATNSTPALDIDNLALGLPDNRCLIANLNLHVAPGDRMLISGPTGSGKSTLIRAIAGIWPFGAGSVHTPAGRVLFIPQRPYLPNGALIQSLTFPYNQPLDPTRVAAVLTSVGLGRLATKLDTAEPWDRELSPGEQQRIAFARCILLEPDVIILDEATSALDEDYEALMYQTLTTALPRATIISVGHRSTIVKYHTRRLRLTGDSAWHDEAINPIQAAAD